MLKAELKVTGGTHAGQTISLAKQHFLIGRGEDCQLRPASEQISRHHCVFSVDEFTVRLRDLGSTNGTFVNDQRLHGEVVLKRGDTVRFGALNFEMQISNQQVTYDSDAALPLLPEDPLLPKDTAPDTAELAASETVLDLPASATETLNGGEVASSETLVVAPQQQPVVPVEPQNEQPPPPGVPQMAPPSPPDVPQGQPYPPQPVPAAMPYPPQAGYPYPPQPGMAYPQQPYPYPGYMPMPGQYQQPMQYPPASEFPPAEATAPSAAPAEETTELPVKLPDPETTGATAPEEKPPAPADDGGEKTPASDPSTMAAAAIRNMRSPRPGSP